MRNRHDSGTPHPRTSTSSSHTLEPVVELSGADTDVQKRLLSAASFFAPFFLYVATLAPTVTFEDSGEFIAAASHLGVPHPPGYPLWCLLAHAFTWIPWGSVAERVHLCSAFFGAATAWFVYSVTLRLFGNRYPVEHVIGIQIKGVHRRGVAIGLDINYLVKKYLCC